MAASEGMATVVPLAPTPNAAPELAANPQAVWAVAAQLAGGMLANPAKATFTVKDSISLFDEVLHEITSYAALRGEFGVTAKSDYSDRRKQRAEAFLGNDRRAAAPRPRPVPPPRAEVPQPTTPAPSSGDANWTVANGSIPHPPIVPGSDGHGREAAG